MSAELVTKGHSIIGITPDKPSYIQNLPWFEIINPKAKVIIHAVAYYRNSQHVHREFTIAFDQSDSRTHPCHVRIWFTTYLEVVEADL